MENNSRKKLHRSSQLIHSPKVKMVEGNRSILSPVYQSAKFAIAPGVPLMEQFFYTRIANPTLRELELALSELQGMEDCIVLSSGLAAITGTLLGLLKADDHVIVFRETYRPGRVFVRDILPRFKIESSVIKLSETHELEKYIRPGTTKMIYFESPSNPHLQIADIKLITSIARKHGLLVMMDGTFSGPHQHQDMDIDIMIHSLTKYTNGHGDVVAGAIISNQKLISEVRKMTIMLGATLDPHAAFLISRGMKTYLLRYERQSLTAGEVTTFLSTHPKIKKVYYPGRLDQKQSDLAHAQMQDMGGILAFEIDPALGTALEFCHRLKLLQFTASVGSTESLICPTLMFFGDDLNASDKMEMGINEYSLRLAVGLEHSQDIINDLSQALS